MRSQLVVARWFAARGWKYAASTGSGRSGIDIENMPGLAPEVKARHGFNLTGWLKQATTNAGVALPFVVVRPDGYGETRIAEWPVVITLEDFTYLLRDAGYGDGEVGTYLSDKALEVALAAVEAEIFGAPTSFREVRFSGAPGEDGHQQAVGDTEDHQSAEGQRE
jgi:hypothetical protein